MTRYAIDAPTLLRLADGDLTVDPAHQLVAPSRIRSEALEQLLRDVRAGTRTEKDARQLHTRITELKIRVLGDRASRWTAWKIARDQDWDTLRDAEYLAVAQLQADALVTVDPQLAAKADGVVAVGRLENLFE